MLCKKKKQEEERVSRSLSNRTPPRPHHYHCHCWYNFYWIWNWILTGQTSYQEDHWLLFHHLINRFLQDTEYKFTASHRTLFHLKKKKSNGPLLKCARWTIVPTQAWLLSFSVFDYGVNCVIGQTENYLWVVFSQISQFGKSIRKDPLWHQRAHWILSTFDKFHMADIFQRLKWEIVRIVNISYYIFGQQKLLTQLKGLYCIWDYFHCHFGHSYLATWKFFLPWIEVLEFQLLFDWIFANSIRNKFELPCQTLIWTPRSIQQKQNQSTHTLKNPSFLLQQRIAECPQI